MAAAAVPLTIDGRELPVVTDGFRHARLHTSRRFCRALSLGTGRSKLISS